MRYLPLACFALAFAACLDTPTKRIDPVVETKDAGPDASADGGAATPCERDEDCEGAQFSRCGEDGRCAPCEDSTQCERFADARACVARQGCFACAPDDVAHCADDRKLCSSDFKCVQCTEANQSACGEATRPFCATDLGSCVECVTGDHCADVTLGECNSNVCSPCSSDEGCMHFERTKLCDGVLQKCIECRSDADCGADAPVCDTATGTCGACSGNEQCARFDDAKVCGDGACVQCTFQQDEACEGAQGGPFVCDARTHACSDQKPASADVCAACVSDAQCKQGQACVSDGTSADSWACQWIKAGGGAAPAVCGSGSRPFAKNASADSIDGASVAICTLANSTCSAHRAYRTSCGRFGDGEDSIIVENRLDDELPNGPVDADAIEPDDSVCGVSGRCVANDAEAGAYLCSVACLNSDNDCPAGPVTCGGLPPGLPNVCSI